MNDLLGKKAEAKIKEWLDRPEEGYDFNRIPDQMSGLKDSDNICDFTLFKYPYHYYIESKSTWDDVFKFSMLTNTQYTGLLEKSKIPGVFGIVMVLFATYKRAFIFDIREIDRLNTSVQKSLNIKKINKWDCWYQEIQTIPNNRKELLDYIGEFELNFDKPIDK